MAPSGRALPEQTKGSTVERRRLTDDGPEPEAVYLIEQKGQRVLGLVYATDSRMGLDAMCRLVERLPSVLKRHGGGLVGISAESSEENDDYQPAALSEAASRAIVSRCGYEMGAQFWSIKTSARSAARAVAPRPQRSKDLLRRSRVQRSGCPS
jgi:hypothetical protein